MTADPRPAPPEHAASFPKRNDAAIQAARLLEGCCCGDAYTFSCIESGMMPDKMCQFCRCAFALKVTQLHYTVPEHADRDAKKHVIYSGEHRAYWGANRSGYVDDLLGAGLYSRKEAESATEHCGPEKLISITSLLPLLSTVREGTVGELLLKAIVPPARTPESASGTAEPVAWLVKSGADYYSVPLTDEQDAKDTAASWESNGLDRPIVLVPLFLHPAAPPSVGDTPSAEPQ